MNTKSLATALPESDRVNGVTKVSRKDMNQIRRQLNATKAIFGYSDVESFISDLGYVKSKNGTAILLGQ